MPLVVGPFGRARIAGAGTAFPPRHLTNEEVLTIAAPRLWPDRESPRGERLAFLARGLEESLGVRERAWAHVPGEPFDHGSEPTTIDLGAEAARAALADAGRDDVALVLCSTSTPARMTSTTSAAVAARLGLKRAVCMDVRTGCAGGLFALTTAAMYLDAGADAVLVLGTETFSKVIPPSYKPAVVALGDGAGAIVLERGEAMTQGLRAAFLATDGALGRLVSTDGALPPTEGEIARGGYQLSGEGEELAAVLPGKYEEAIGAALTHAKKTTSDLGLYVPHQTSVPLIREVARRVGVHEAKTFVNVPKHANVGAAGWIVALAEARAEGRVPSGGSVLLAAVGGGMSWAAAILDT